VQKTAFLTNYRKNSTKTTNQNLKPGILYLRNIQTTNKWLDMIPKITKQENKKLQ